MMLFHRNKLSSVGRPRAVFNKTEINYTGWFIPDPL
jgi:hypothetical protein